MKFLFFIIFLFVFDSCTNLTTLDTNVNITVEGRIDEKMYLKHAEHFNTSHDVLINSAGGENLYAAKIAKLVSDSNSAIIVQNECISACVEFLLPAANLVEFLDAPIIGFHWGPLMDFGQYERVFKQPERCYFSTLDTQRNLFKEGQLNIDFWQEIEKRLVLTHFSLVEKTSEECPWKNRSFKNDLWLPTSQQLKEMWGLKFTGSVCSDDFKKCSKRVDRRWKAGTRIVIGDEVYVSKGR